MVKITPENITQEEIFKLLEALVILKEITDKLDENQMKGANLVQKVALRKYKKRISNIYEDIDNKK